MKITKEMVMNLNIELAIKGCPFRYKFVDDMIISSMEITLPSMNCVDSFIVNPTKEFFDWLKMCIRDRLKVFHLRTGHYMTKPQCFPCS